MRRVLFPVLLVVLAAGGAAAYFMRPKPTVTLPIIATLPPFSFTDQHGKTLDTAALRGHPWVADFIFTRCAMVCPVLTAKLAVVDSKTRDVDGLRFVSFSVDPDYDQPPVLAAYAKERHADTPRWFFVTGPLAQVTDTVVRGLKVDMEPNPNATGSGDAILHGTHFVLVDGAGQIRGYYDSNVPERLDQLVADARALSFEK